MKKSLYSISSLILYNEKDIFLDLQGKVIQKLPHLKDHKSNIPHISYHSSFSPYPFIIKEKLENICIFFHQFEIKASGLGIFNYKNFSVYLTLSKNEQLLKLQKNIFEIADKFNPSPNSELYNPDNWIPHISLFYDIKSLSDTLRISEILLKENLNFTISIKTIVSLYKKGETEGSEYCFYLK